MKTDYHRRLPGFEPYDMVTIETTPRFKTSGLSGDEWRTSAVVTLWFKGQAIHERAFRDIATALAFLPGWLIQECEPIATKVIEIERETCDQPGCNEPAVSKYRLKRLTSDRGEWLDASEGESFDSFRRFCKRRLHRGDASREDCDENYEVVEGPGPGDAEGWLGDVSPSQTVVLDLAGDPKEPGNG